VTEERFCPQLNAADVLAARLDDYLAAQHNEPTSGWVVHWERILEALADYQNARDASKARP
jgi:hypothetical protein